jgi:sugar phosphate isomerase/epimerase
MKNSRRKFIVDSSIYTGSFVIGGSFLLSSCKGKESESMDKDVSSATTRKPASELIKISLAEWSYNKEIFSGEMDHLDFAAKSKSMGFEGVEYVNQFFMDKGADAEYLKEMNMRASDAGIKQLLIMIDREGGLAQTDKGDLAQAIENHKKWVEAAKTLGCHSIRVNAYGAGSSEDVSIAAIDGLGQLATFAKDYDINVIVENHGGYSSNGKWLANVMSQINMDNCGTLPDFGNFCIERNEDRSCKEEYDKYLGVQELMPFAKAVSAKANEFDDEGNEVNIDYAKMMKIVLDAGYEGFIGVEYEGARMTNEEGIIATRDLIKKVIKDM